MNIFRLAVYWILVLCASLGYGQDGDTQFVVRSDDMARRCQVNVAGVPKILRSGSGLQIVKYSGAMFVYDKSGNFVGFTDFVRKSELRRIHGDNFEVRNESDVRRIGTALLGTIGYRDVSVDEGHVELYSIDDPNPDARGTAHLTGTEQHAGYPVPDGRVVAIELDRRDGHATYVNIGPEPSFREPNIVLSRQEAASRARDAVLSASDLMPESVKLACSDLESMVQSASLAYVRGNSFLGGRAARSADPLHLSYRVSIGRECVVHVDSESGDIVGGYLFKAGPRPSDMASQGLPMLVVSVGVVLVATSIFAVRFGLRRNRGWS
jgi:hypothetical protein